MAQTYSSTPVLSEITLPNGNLYYLKDADARAILDTLKSAAFLDADSSITDSATGVAKTAQIKAYVDSAIKIGVSVVKVDTLPTASASTEGKIYIVPQSQGKTDDNFDEYITIKGGTAQSPAYSWEKIGDTRIDLSGYVTNVSYTAGTHKLQQTKNGTTTDVHTFGALADKSQASGSYTKPTGSGSVTVPKTFTFTGSAKTVTVTGDVPTYESVPIDLEVSTDKEQFVKTVTGTKNSAAISTTRSGGATASLGTASTKTFTTAGVTVAINNEHPERLVISNAGTDSAVTGYPNFNGGTLPTSYNIAANSVVVSVSDTKDDALTDAALFDGSSSGTITVSAGVTTGDSQSVTSTGSYTPAGSVATNETESKTVSVGVTSDTVTVS